MKLKAFAVIDTNVIISSVYSASGFPADVLGLVRSGNVIPIFDERMLDEYYKVLHYSKFNGKFTEKDIYDVLYTIVSNGIMINDVEQAKNELQDKEDIPFFEVKESSDEFDSYLVTGNIKHFPESNSTVTPKEFLAILDALERWVKKEFDYEKCVEELKATQLSTQKYSLGKELLVEMFDTETKKIKKSYFEMG